MLERLPSFEPRHEGAFQGYVRTALLNRIRDIARQYQRKGAQDPLDSEITGHEHSPLDLAIGQETIDRYEAALERLRPEERDLIIARIEMGLPHAEIARMFDKPSVAAVHMALSRALVRLAEEMAHERETMTTPLLSAAEKICEWRPGRLEQVQDQVATPDAMAVAEELRSLEPSRGSTDRRPPPGADFRSSPTSGAARLARSIARSIHSQLEVALKVTRLRTPGAHHRSRTGTRRGTPAGQGETHERRQGVRGRTD